MRWNFRRWAGMAILGCGAAGAATTPVVGLHPGYTLMTIRPENFQPQVTGLEFLPNGDMLVLTWRGDTGPGVTASGVYTVGKRTGESKLYRVTNVKGTDRSAIKSTQVAGGFKDAMGLCVVDNDVYIGDIDRIVKLVDANGDGVYESSVEVGKLPFYSTWFEYGFGPVHKAGKLYMGLAVGVQLSGFPQKQLGLDRGTVVSLPIGGGTYSVVAEGFRAPNGLAFDAAGELFATDNQGGWRPASQMHHVVQDRFYGYMVDPKGAIQTKTNAKVTPPAIWMPYSEANTSPTEPALMKTGPYAGQFIYGDINMGGIYHAFLEKVKDAATGLDEYQGAIWPLSGGLEVGMDRLRTTDKGEIYMGGVGMGASRAEGWNGTTFGLQKLTPNGTQVFEIIALRSRAKGMELEFSMPVGEAAKTASNYSIQQWYYTPTSSYGGSKQGATNHTVSSAQVSPDGKRVYLEIDGLKTGRVVYIACNANVKSTEGKSLWFDKSWYTLNAISASQPFEASTAAKPAFAAGELPGFSAQRSGSGLKVSLPGSFAWRVRLLDFQGRPATEEVSASGKAVLDLKAVRPGLYILRAEGSDGRALSKPLIF